jgi:hypothetical protein
MTPGPTTKPAARHHPHASKGWVQLVPPALRSAATGWRPAALPTVLFLALAALAYTLVVHRMPGHQAAWVRHAAHQQYQPQDQQQPLPPGVSDLYEMRHSTGAPKC